MLQIIQNAVFCKGILAEKVEDDFLVSFDVSIPVRYSALLEKLEKLDVYPSSMHQLFP